jgi:hypothetical protein
VVSTPVNALGLSCTTPPSAPGAATWIITKTTTHSGASLTIMRGR